MSDVISNTWALTMSRMRLAMRNRAFLFFSLIMPLAFLFIYAGIFGRGRAQAVPYLLAEVLALTVMGSFWGLSVQLVTFREQGILRRFRVTPVGASAMLASSLVSNYFLTLPTIAIEFFLSRSVFHMAGLGNVLSIFVLVTIGTVTFASLGLIVASVTNTMQETQIINQIIWFVFLFISGATIPFPFLPGVVQAVAVFLPATYLVSGLQRAMIDHTNLSGLGMYLASLVGSALIAFVISAQLFRWEPESKAPRQAKLWAAAAVIPFLLLGVWETVNGDLRSHAMKNLQSIREPIRLNGSSISGAGFSLWILFALSRIAENPQAKACSTQIPSLHMRVEDAGFDAACTFYLNKDAIVARLRKPVREADFRGKRAGVRHRHGLWHGHRHGHLCGVRTARKPCLREFQSGHGDRSRRVHVGKHA